MLNKEKPYVLLVAELIYKKIIDIKKNPDFSNINAIEAFIGSSTYLDISKGNFHDRLISKLSKNNFTKKVSDETIKLLHIQKNISIKQLIQFQDLLCKKSLSIRNMAKSF